MNLDKIIKVLLGIVVLLIIGLGSYFGFTMWGKTTPVEVTSNVVNKKIIIADGIGLQSYLREIGYGTSKYWKILDDRNFKYGKPATKISVMLSDKDMDPKNVDSGAVVDKSAWFEIANGISKLSVFEKLSDEEATKFLNEQFMQNIELIVPQQIGQWKIARSKYLTEKTFFKIVSK